MHTIDMETACLLTAATDVGSRSHPKDEFLRHEKIWMKGISKQAQAAHLSQKKGDNSLNCLKRRRASYDAVDLDTALISEQRENSNPAYGASGF